MRGNGSRALVSDLEPGLGLRKAFPVLGPTPYSLLQSIMSHPPCPARKGSSTILVTCVCSHPPPRQCLVLTSLLSWASPLQRHSHCLHLQPPRRPGIGEVRICCSLFLTPSSYTYELSLALSPLSLNTYFHSSFCIPFRAGDSLLPAAPGPLGFAGGICVGLQRGGNNWTAASIFRLIHSLRGDESKIVCFVLFKTMAALKASVPWGCGDWGA